MIEEVAKVIQIDGQTVWVSAIQKSACGSCQAQKGCGHSLLAKVGQKQIDFPVLRHELDVAIDDQVLIGVPEQAVLRSSLLMYGLPLALMLVLALLANGLGAPEGLVVLSALVGMVLGFLGVSKWSKSLNFALWHPTLIRKVEDQQSRIPMCEIHEG